MKLLAYFARVYAGALLLMQLGLVIVVLATTFVENAGYLTRTTGSGGTAVQLAVFGAITFGYQVFPVAVFLAALTSGTMLARSGELLAVQAAGISTRRIAVSFAVVVSIAVLLGGIAGEVFVPRATARLARLQGTAGASDPLSRFYDRHTQWFRERDTLLYLPSLDFDTQTFMSPVVYRFDKGLIAAITDAERLEHQGGGWMLINAKQQSVSDGMVRAHASLPLQLSASPSDLIDVAGDPRQMLSDEVASVIERRIRAGFDAAAYRIELHSRLAFPLSALGLFVLGIPWMFNPDRRRSLAVNLGMGVVAVAIMLSLTQVFRLLGLARRVPPPLGAWGVDVVCLLVLPLSFWLFRRYRTRGTIF